MNEKKHGNIWRLVSEVFDEKLPRRTGILVKEDDFGLPFAYPSEFGKIGWLLDNRQKTTYDESPVALFAFGEYSFPDLSGKALAKNTFYFNRMQYFPSLVKREIIFSNIGIEAFERFAQSPQGGFIWELDLSCQNHPCYLFEKRLYVMVAMSHADCNIKCSSSSKMLEIQFAGKKLFITSNFDRCGVYHSAENIPADLRKGKMTYLKRQGSCILLEYNVRLRRHERKKILFGISFSSSAKARHAFKETKFEEKIERRWNQWFTMLPALPFASEKDQKAYYKCWWIVRTNYYLHPCWGKTVLEALPVYRGYWQWSLPAVEWHADLNPEIGPPFVKTVLDLFLTYQRSDGYVTHAVYLDEKNPGEIWAARNIIQTPHIPWVALRYYHFTNDIESLKQWYPALLRYYRYLNESRDNRFLRLHLWAIIASYDTGLDTFPVFQKVTYGENGTKEKFCYPAIFAAERCRYEEAMAEMAVLLGTGEEEGWRKEAQLTRAAMDKVLWDKKKHWYGVLHENKLLDTRVGIDGLFPFAYRLVSKKNAGLAGKNFLKLLGEYGVFTVAPDELGFYEEIYWRGPAWTKSCSVAMATALNYYPDLLGKVKEGLVNFILHYPSVWECMSARTGKIGRGDMGLMATPCISSNVGAGEAIGALLTFYGTNMFAFRYSKSMAGDFDC